MEINHTNIIVTGAASGIGHCLVNELLNFDCKIIAADINAELLNKVTSSYTDKVKPYVCNLANPDHIDQLFETSINLYGSVDIFIANAGFGYYEQLKEGEWSRLEQIFRVNTISPIYSLLKMNKINSGKPWKTVILCSAMAEWNIPGYTLYSTTKTAIHRFADSYKFDNSNNNLMTVYPIATRTKFFEKAGGNSMPIPFPVQSPETVAKKIIKGVLEDKRKLYPARLFRSIVMINRILPIIKPLYQLHEQQKQKEWLKTNHSSRTP